MILFILPIAMIMRAMREFWWVFVLLLLASWLSGCGAVKDLAPCLAHTCN